MSPTVADAFVANELIRLAATPVSKEAAIREACQLLIAAGCVEPGYEASMISREAVANTFLGHGVSIPHGLGEDRGLVRRDGLAVLQIPGGIEWNPGQTAKLVVAIAARSDSHITILRRLTRLIQDDARLERLFVATDAGELVEALTQDEATVAATAPAVDLPEHFTWAVEYPVGLHARPAAVWVEAARGSGVRIQVRHGGEIADARNLVALLQLGLRAGDSVTISADGEQAATALARFRSVITGLTAQEKADAAKAAERAEVPVNGWVPSGAPRAIVGIGASPGIAIGVVHLLTAAQDDIPDVPVQLSEGGNLLHEALIVTRQQMVALVDDTTRRLGAADAAIFKAQGELLNDSDLITLTCQLMVEGHGVAWSWNQAVERMASRLTALGNPVLAARAADLRDVGRRVLSRLHPVLKTGSLTDVPDHPCIIVANDLSPSDTAGLDKDRVIGLATALGGPTSHTAILARTLGLPAIVAGGAGLLDVANGTPAIIDGQTGRLYLSPSEADLVSAKSWIAERARRRATEEAERGLPARTSDGHVVAIGANVNRPDQVPLALREGGEGVGLMRTEFLFLERDTPPSEDEQFETYRGMIDALDGRPLIVRALDIGGDKQVAHLHLPHEENPFLGVRGARLLLRRPDLLDPQLRALYRAAAGGGDLSIMFPMVTSVGEVSALRAACERIRSELGAPCVPLGIMIEVPAAAIQADSLAAHVDFFSIGTNDLTQYTLAIDRQNPDLAAEADSLHPAVLRLIRQTVEGAARHKRWVGVCGGIAGDPFGAALLAGLGVNELSMTPRDIPAVKARLRGCELSALRALAERALAVETAQQVRALDSLS
ncbi:phosphoenolpyruvate--protein phosphotransferase [Telmatospirillum siberiense]|uniref:phosphoenolpyruvate--protein phosphotransferase n=1 Tax=Telmatospirillum siberiense TaxID=382514 RepID=A0A2N3PXF6_9PROT|nr:phosphoenolpyruvate--protein phosphotransferase [Telmatospirillum siberiense]PKU25068.1 phosphoenolpyruvate--protein phosphotransferase [Telmatospirillum siberiense]